MTRTGRLLAGGAVSGAIWFAIAIAFDKGVRDFNVPVIPTASLSEIAVSLLAAVASGVGVALVFSHAWDTRSRILLSLTPIGALATGVLAFSVVTWILGQAAGAATERLGVVVSTLLSYAMLSAFTPFLYVLALSNCLVIRRVMRRAA